MLARSASAQFGLGCARWPISSSRSVSFPRRSSPRPGCRPPWFRRARPRPPRPRAPRRSRWPRPLASLACALSALLRQSALRSRPRAPRAPRPRRRARLPAPLWPRVPRPRPRRRGLVASLPSAHCGARFGPIVGGDCAPRAARRGEASVAQCAGRVPRARRWRWRWGPRGGRDAGCLRVGGARTFSCRRLPSTWRSASHAPLSPFAGWCWPTALSGRASPLAPRPPKVRPRARLQRAAGKGRGRGRGPPCVARALRPPRGRRGFSPREPWAARGPRGDARHGVVGAGDRA